MLPKRLMFELELLYSVQTPDKHLYIHNCDAH